MSDSNAPQAVRVWQEYYGYNGYSPGTQGVFDVAQARLHQEKNSSVVVPTSVVAGNEIVSPSVVFVPNGWHGFRYWMMTTPYTGSDPELENPEIYCSNDGITFTAPTGVTNPIVGSPSGVSYNSDCNLTLSPDGSALQCLFRSFINATSVENLWYMTSTDGSRWTTPILLKSWAGAVTRFQSPSLVWDDRANVWRIFLVEFVASAPNYELQYITSSNITGTWSSLSACTYTRPVGINSLWQGDVRKLPDGSLLCLMQTGDASGGKYYLMKSTDMGLNWEFSPSLWPARNVYGGCIVPRDTYLEAYFGYLLPLSSERTLIVFDRSQYLQAVSSSYASAWPGTQLINSASIGVGAYVVADSFNRADTAAALGAADSGQTWGVASGTLGIASNQAYAPGAGNNKSTIEAGSADVEIMVTWNVVPGGGGAAWVLLRYIDANTYFRIGCGPTGPILDKITGAAVVFNQNFVGITQTAGDVMRIRAEGNRIRCYWNEKCWVDIEDTQGNTEQTHGIRMDETACRLDNFMIRKLR